MEIFEANTWPLYFLGFFTFLTTLIENIMNPNKKMHKFMWYLQEFLYTLISIILGICICYELETSNSISYIVSITMGIIGSTIIRKIVNKRDTICDELIDTVKGTVKNKIESKIESKIGNENIGNENI